MENQMNLELDAKRERVRLLDETPKPRARVPLLDEEALIKVCEEAAKVAEPEYSPWRPCLFMPPESGLWDIRPHWRKSGEPPIIRVRFDKKTGGWTLPSDWHYSLADCYWRGLAHDPARA